MVSTIEWKDRAKTYVICASPFSFERFLNRMGRDADYSIAHNLSCLLKGHVILTKVDSVSIDGEGNIGIIIDNKAGIKHPCDFSQSERFEKDLSACFVLFPVLYPHDARLQDYLDGLIERVNP